MMDNQEMEPTLEDKQAESLATIFARILDGETVEEHVGNWKIVNESIEGLTKNSFTVESVDGKERFSFAWNNEGDQIIIENSERQLDLNRLGGTLNVLNAGATLLAQARNKPVLFKISDVPEGQLKTWLRDKQFHEDSEGKFHKLIER